MVKLWRFLLFSMPDRGLLLRGVLGADPEGPEDGVWRGYHRHSGSQEEEGIHEEKTGTPLHQLLLDHVMWRLLRIHLVKDHKPNMDWRQNMDKMQRQKPGGLTDKTRASSKNLEIPEVSPELRMPFLPKELKTHPFLLLQDFCLKSTFFYNHFNLFFCLFLSLYAITGKTKTYFSFNMNA